MIRLASLVLLGAFSSTFGFQSPPSRVVAFASHPRTEAPSPSSRCNGIPATSCPSARVKHQLYSHRRRPRAALAFPPQPHNVRSPASVRLFSSTEEEEGGDGGDRVPFYARALKRIRRWKNADDDDDDDDDDDGEGKSGGVKEQSPSVEERTLSEQETAEYTVASLRALAVKTRLEAELMDTRLTIGRIAKLEGEMDKHSDGDEEKMRSSVRTRAREIARRLEPPETKAAEKKGPATTTTTETVAAATSTARDDEQEAAPTSDTDLISPEELGRRLREWEEGSTASRALLAKSAGLDQSNATAVVLQNYNNEQRKQRGLEAIVSKSKDGSLPKLSDVKRKEAIDKFDLFPRQIQKMMARTAGFGDANPGAEVIIDTLIEKGKLSDDGEQFSVVGKAVDFEVELDPDDERKRKIEVYMTSLLPEVTRAFPVYEPGVETFYSQILGKDTFLPSGKMEQVAGGYLIRGESSVKPKEGEDEGTALIEAIDAKMITKREKKFPTDVPWTDMITAYYILDPTPPSMEEIVSESDELPLLFITRSVLSPDTALWVKPFVTLLGLASVAVFVAGVPLFDEAFTDRLTALVEGKGDADLGYLYDAAAPLLLAILGTQLAHELGHRAVALRDDIEIGLPTLVPGLQFGLTGAITPLESPPKNFKSLFDFAFAGPLLGTIVSLVLLYVGIEATVFVTPEAREHLPALPVQLLRSSSLGGGIIEYLMGDGLLNSPNPNEALKLHPYAIAGFGGLVVNALNLLPIGNTDGGRISLAFFGRSLSRVVHRTAIFALIIAGVVGADEANVLLCYALFTQLYQQEAEVPCRDEVTQLDEGRGFVAIAASVFVVLTLVPLPT